MMSKHRLPKHKRVANPPPMQLTARDRAVVQAVYRYRFLRQDQIQTLFFPSKWAAQYRLVRLYQHGYLDRTFTPVQFGSGQIVYCLDDKGADLVIADLGIDREAMGWKRKHNRVGGPFLEHTLAVNDVRIALELACYQLGYGLEGWLDETDLKKEHGKREEFVPVLGSNGKTRQVAVIADGYFVVHCLGKRAHFFLEVDRATIANKRWMQKIRAYIEYYRSGKYQARYGTRSLRVLTVTTGDQRVANLKASTEKAGGGQTFWFTTMDRARAEYILTEPVWQVAGQDSAYRLLE